MISLKQVKGIMQKNKIAPEILAQMDFEASGKGNNSQPALAIIDKMDELLTKDQKYAVMEVQGCCKGGERDIACKAFGAAHKDKTLPEKIEALKVERLQNQGLFYVFPPTLNDDGTLTIQFGGYQNGVHKGKNTCSCGGNKKVETTIFGFTYILRLLRGAFYVSLSKRFRS